jgi:hypothetical protein
MARGTIEQLRLLAQWSPLLGYLRRYADEPDANARSVIVADGLEWAASRTESRLDDDLARHVAAVLKTPQGAALVQRIVQLFASLETTP